MGFPNGYDFLSAMITEITKGRRGPRFVMRASGGQARGMPATIPATTVQFDVNLLA
jgi:hypothetical protein